VRRVVVAGALCVALALGTATAAAAAPPVGVSISINGGSAEVRAGDRLFYIATLRNGGTSAVEGRLVITVPDFVRVADAAGADRSGSAASWDVTVPVGGTVSEKLTGVLERIPKGELRVTTLASLYLAGETQPTIRTADAAAIEGVRDTARAAGDRPVTPAVQPWLVVWIGLAILVLAAIGALAAWRLVVRRRRRLRA